MKTCKRKLKSKQFKEMARYFQQVLQVVIEDFAGSGFDDLFEPPHF